MEYSFEFQIACAIAIVAGVAVFWGFAAAFSGLDDVRRRVGRLEGSLAPARSRDTAAAAAIAVDESAESVWAVDYEVAAAEPAAAAEAIVSPGAQPPEGRRGAVDWEIFAGGRLLNIIGGFVLVIGVGLALKYAFDKNWINEWLRIAAGVAAGGGLLVTSEIMRSRKTHPWFTQGLTGTGLGMLYVSGYAAFESYHLWSFALAYAFMSCVTIVAFLLAVRSNSLAVALLGWAGGFVTPFVMGENRIGQVELASYIVLLDFGLVAMALAKERWFALEPLALVSSYVMALGWYVLRGDLLAEPFVSAIAVLSIWSVFFTAGIARSLRSEQPYADIERLLGIANLFAVCASLAQVLVDHRTAFECAVLGLAVAYGIAYAALVRRRPDAAAERIITYLSAGALVLVATAHHVHDMALPVAFVSESVALVVCERLLQRFTGRRAGPELGLSASGLLLASGGAFVFAGDALVHSSIWNIAYGTRDFALLALIAGAYGVDRLLQGTAWPESAGVVLRQAAVLGVATLAAVHLDHYDLAAAYAYLALAVTAIGTRAMLQDVELDGAFLGALAVIVATVQPDTWQLGRIFAFVPFNNARFESLVVIALALLGSAEMLRRRSLLPGELYRTLRAVGALVAVGAVTLDVRDAFGLALAQARLEIQTPAVMEHIVHLAGAEHLALSATWILASLILVGLGVKLCILDLRLMAIALFDLTILKAFFVDLGDMDALYRIAVFIGLGLVLLGVSYMYQRLERGFFSVAPRSGEAAISA